MLFMESLHYQPLAGSHLLNEVRYINVTYTMKNETQSLPTTSADPKIILFGELLFTEINFIC